MPELPEMENYRKLLSERILDQSITNVTVSREKSINVTPEVFEKELVNERIVYIERRGKHLIFHMSTGKRLVLHLMLGGILYIGTEQERPKRSTQVEIEFGEVVLYFIGLRLGYLHLLSAKETDELMSDLGPEPLDYRFTLEKFKERLKGRRGTIKTTLVNQRVIAGIGNCYSDEIAFAASLRPDTKIQDVLLNEDALSRLYHAIQSVLREATAGGGYMEMPLYAGDELTGKYDEQCRVYDREGETCTRCNEGIINKVEITGKKAFFCPVCQH
ncbi:DNA-formamidopyrimidine glycosylase family protein [Paenibacillus polygoni]|uniref:DNA-formamidopyrimidine glycosylase family protein n=1 Tax=Paenibacillus polygoni TaxID=3050112 RepID=A0ABY8X0N7_9BACL|nr:DNA-formamidopyrimidine glycosylase family protein [Paenibacillus polygoni]WIV17828.1 DNA-formamidopyrimidine glycosylase family protein [Paenibacillus polygoni]